MGNTFMAYDPNITRGVLAVPGGAWSLLFERSNAWHAADGRGAGQLRGSRGLPAQRSRCFGMGFEPYDPITTAAHVIKDPLFGDPVKNILIWYALGDCLVTNISTEMVARTMGIDAARAVGEDAVGHARQGRARSPTASSCYDEHPTPLPSDTNIPPAEDNGTHSGVNRNPSALRQVEQFLLPPSTGVDECLRRRRARRRATARPAPATDRLARAPLDLGQPESDRLSPVDSSPIASPGRRHFPRRR